MSARTQHSGLCPVPFLDESTFADRGGNVASRLCSPVGPDLKCCLPCPATDWVYTPSLKIYFKVAGAFSAVGLVLCLFLLVSWAILPPETTKRHAFGTTLTGGIVCICVAFIIGIVANPPQCFDEITPNDLHSNVACAFSGAFVVAGAVTVSTWVSIRAVAMHLHVCWNITPGNAFSYCTHAIGWGITITLFVYNLIVTGVSYRFGPTCHINSHKALLHYWTPLFGLTGLATVLTVVTMLYCMYIYLKYSAMERNASPNGSIDLSTSLSGAPSTRLLYRRMTKAFWLNWRSVVIIGLVLLDLAFYSAVYVKLDHIILGATDGTPKGFARVWPYLECLIAHEGDRTQCYAEAGKALVTESTALAILMLLSVAGIQCFALLVSNGIFVAWRDLIRNTFISTDEFASIHANPPPYSITPKYISEVGNSANMEMLDSVKKQFHPTVVYVEHATSRPDTPSPVAHPVVAPWAVPAPLDRHQQVTASHLLPRVLEHGEEQNEETKGMPTVQTSSTRKVRLSAQSTDSTGELSEAKAVTVTRFSQESIHRSPSRSQ